MEDVFDNAPFLSPWYFTENKPMIISDGKLLKWKNKGSLKVLVDENKLYGIIDSYTNILPSDDGKYFCIWNEPDEGNGNYISVTIDLYKSDLLDPFEGGIDTEVSQYISKKYHYCNFNTKPVASVKINLSGDLLESKVQFPEDFKLFKSFITIEKVPLLYNDWKPEWQSVALVELDILNGKVFIYPQDWFNKSNLDFGYQWLTRAIRHNGKIKLKGIRMPENMTLDKTNRNLV